MGILKHIKMCSVWLLVCTSVTPDIYTETFFDPFGHFDNQQRILLIQVELFLSFFHWPDRLISGPSRCTKTRLANSKNQSSLILLCLLVLEPLVKYIGRYRTKQFACALRWDMRLIRYRSIWSLKAIQFANSVQQPKVGWS